MLAGEFAMTYSMEEGQLTIGTLTKAFKFKKIPLLYNLNTLDAYSWGFLITATLSILFLNTYIRYFFYPTYLKENKLIYFVKKLITTKIDYKNRVHFKISMLLVSLLIIRHICVVIFPNCLSSNYIVLDKSNLANSLKDLLDEKTIVLSTALDASSQFIRKTPIQRFYFDKLVSKLDKCGKYCYVETLNRCVYTIYTSYILYTYSIHPLSNFFC